MCLMCRFEIKNIFGRLLRMGCVSIVRDFIGVQVIVDVLKKSQAYIEMGGFVYNLSSLMLFNQFAGINFSQNSQLLCHLTCGCTKTLVLQHRRH